MKRMLFCVLTTLITGSTLLAEIVLPTVFTDHMVLQRGQSVPVWGMDSPGNTITVEFANQIKTAFAGPDGNWRTDLNPLQADTKPHILTITSSAGSKTEVRDVLVGDVWLCSGQSNMQSAMKNKAERADDIAAGEQPLIRLYRTPYAFSKKPIARIDSAWTRCTPATLPDFSAVGYYFGRRLVEELHVPIGLIQSAWGGTRIEPWTPPCGFEGFESLADIRKKINDYPAQFGTDRQKRKKERQHPTAIYNAMIHPHIPFAIKGVIWYQGEANRRDGMLYMDKTAALLQGWRGLWGYDFPFYFVQIAPYQYGNEEAFDLPEFWEAQAEITKQIPGTGMAVISDAATLNDIHPPNKRIPGTRLARLALDKTYGKDIVSSGPVLRKIDKPLVGGSRLKLVFESAEGLTTRDGKTPDWFEIAGADGAFKPAEAEIKGQSVILKSDKVRDPVAVRFAWHKLATPNLVNGAGLPCAAFRAKMNTTD